MRASARWLRLGMGSTVALLLSGCVYLRLLEVKRQLSDFDRFFSLETTDGVRLGCLNPVLLTDDFIWLGIVPGRTRRIGSSEQWQVRWVKEVPAGTTESLVRDVEIGLVFTDNKLTRLHVPEPYFAVIPKPFFVGLLRGMGSAQVDRARRDAAVAVRSGHEMMATQVTPDALAGLLGTPSERRVEGTRTICRYRYAPTPPGARNGVFDLTFAFDTAGGRLVFLQARTPVGQMSFHFDPPAAETPAIDRSSSNARGPARPPINLEAEKPGNGRFMASWLQH